MCECFKWDFPEQWQGLVNPKMVPDYNEHARSPAETTTAAPSPHEDVDVQQENMHNYASKNGNMEWLLFPLTVQPLNKENQEFINAG